MTTVCTSQNGETATTHIFRHPPASVMDTFIVCAALTDDFTHKIGVATGEDKLPETMLELTADQWRTFYEFASENSDGHMTLGENLVVSLSMSEAQSVLSDPWITLLHENEDTTFSLTPTEVERLDQFFADAQLH